MPISYPPSQAVSQNTANTLVKPTPSLNPPLSFPATTGTVFPVSFSGSAETVVGTFFNPPSWLYDQTGSGYYIEAYASITGSITATGSIVISATGDSITYSVPQGPAGVELAPSYRFSIYVPELTATVESYNNYWSGSGNDTPPLFSTIVASGSNAQVTGTIYGINFVYKHSYTDF